MNPLRGDVRLVILGQPRRLRYGWGAIAALQAELGDNWDAEIAKAVATLNVATMAKVVAIGLQDDWPNVTPAVVIQASPPLAETNAAINRALSLAFHGPGGPAENPPQSLRARVARLWSRLPVWSPQN